MRNYFNKLRWKIIRANNLLQFLHQVIIKLRFQNSFPQERFKSYLELKYQMKKANKQCLLDTPAQ